MKNFQKDQIRLRVFIEGVKLDYVSSVSVSSTGESTSATIGLPASPLLRSEILTGAVVHIFFANSHVLSKAETKSADAVWSDWPLLFQGEVRALSFSAGVDSTSASMTCVSHARHFDQANIHLCDPQSSTNVRNGLLYSKLLFIGNKRHETIVEGQATGWQSRIANKTKDILGKFGGSAEKNIALIAMINEIIRAGELSAGYRMFNHRLNLNNRFAAFGDPDVKRLLEAETIQDLFSKRMKAMPTDTSLYELLKMFSRMLSYDWLHISQPRLLKSSVYNVARETIKIKGLAGSEESYATNFDVVNEEYITYEDDGTLRSQKSVIVEKPRDVSSKLVNSILGYYRRIANGMSSTVNRYSTGGDGIFISEFNANEFSVGPEGPIDPIIPINYDQLITRKVCSIVFALDATLNYMNRNSDENSSKAIGATLQGYTVLTNESIARLRRKSAFNPDSKVFREIKYEPPARIYSENKDVLSNTPKDGSKDAAANSSWSDIQAAMRAEFVGKTRTLNEFASTPNLDFSQPPRCNVITPFNMTNFGIQVDFFAAPTRIYGIAMILDNASGAISGGSAIPKWFVAPLTVYHRVSSKAPYIPEVLEKAYFKGSKERTFSATLESI
jgi:hypothetical protein